MSARTIEIVVRGALGPDVRAALDEFVVEADGNASRIWGRIPDQAKLFGLLEMFDAMHVEVLSVNTLEERG
ncbi:hypothetical protein [Microbacterium yannicii]|uniref:hypothetical protein n=1 Tax=Microbacterium yannicii TaxID=671622 RepID=UPI00037577AE|nr:hypothetical protein [Microbacterium yannicii]